MIRPHVVVPTLAAAVFLTAQHAHSGEEFAPNHAFVPSWSGNRVIEFDEDWNEVRTLGDDAGFLGANDVAFGPDGLLYVTSFSNSKIIQLDATGAKVGEIKPSGLSMAGAVAFGPRGDLYVSSSWGDEVLRVDRHGAVVDVIGASVLQFPRGLAFGPQGHLYVCSINTNRLVEFDAAGAVVRELPVIGPERVAIDSDGVAYVTSWNDGLVHRFAADGTNLGTLGDGSGQVSVTGVAFGPDGRVYVARSSTSSILPFAAGVAEAPIVNANLVGPGQIAFSPRRFKAKLSGKGVAAGEGAWKVKETVTLSIAPGSHTLMIGLADTADTADLATRFDASAFLFRGFETAEDDLAGARLFHGNEVDAGGGLGAGSISLHVKGATPQGCFLPKKATGVVMRTAGGLSFQAKIVAGKAMD